MEIDKIKAQFEGESNFVNSTLNMNAGITMPRNYLNKDINNIIDEALKIAKKAGVKVKVDDNLNINANITGDVKNPKYSLTYGPEKAKTPGEYLQKEADKIFKKVKKESGKKLEKEATKFLKGLFK
jgi:translation initiation factor 2 alpha subunit (eIF-2alpha)